MLHEAPNMKLAPFAFTLLAAAITASSANAQTSMTPPPSLSGLTANPAASESQLRLSSGDDWQTFFGGSLFATYVSTTGAHDSQNQFFSTNWLVGGVTHEMGRATLTLRGRASLEPYTIPEEGSPQLLQFISASSGGTLVDRMRAQTLLQEAAAELSVRVGATGDVRLYAGLAGDPPLGAVPYAQRASSREFAEAPFSYDIAESYHEATNVVAVSAGTRMLRLEGGVFHNSVSSGRHDSIATGSIDSWAARLTLTPTERLSAQISTGRLGDKDDFYDKPRRTVQSASLSYTVPGSNGELDTTAMFTRAETRTAIGSSIRQNAISGEVTWRSGRNTFLGRIESIDRPITQFADVVTDPAQYLSTKRMTHLTVGYIFDLLAGSYPTGLGVNFDYATQTGSLATYTSRYEHKPQGVYVFARIRTSGR
jgi:hypothetical protein